MKIKKISIVGSIILYFLSNHIKLVYEKKKLIISSIK